MFESFRKHETSASIYYLFFMWCLYGWETAGIILDHPIHDPDIPRNVSELIKSKGYPLEEHTVQTADGYLLSLERIPHGRKNSKKEDDKDNVLLIHGIVTDASTWVLNFPNQSLGFILPDKGYDVWLLNTRGCAYSKKHVTYKTDEHRFWNFSFAQVAQYDVPATIDYILDATGKKYLYIISFSQGTTATFAMLSEMPDYNDKVKLFIALSPVTSVGYISSAVRPLVPLAHFAFLYDIISPGEILSNKFVNITEGEICRMVPDICENIIFAICGPDSGQLNKTRVGVYFSHIPTGTSVKSLVHFAQLVESKKFRKYDYGRYLNMKYYHQEEPLDYDLSSITTPVALFWSKNDALGDPKDVDILRRKLKFLVYDYCVPYPYNHFDFQVAENAAILIYNPVLQLLAGASRETLPTGCK